MLIKPWTIILLLIKGIGSKANLYDVAYDIPHPNESIIKHLQKMTKSSCILRCQRHHSCHRALYKKNSLEDGLGDCWLLEKNQRDLYMAKLAEENELLTFKPIISFCKQNDMCKHGECQHGSSMGRFKCQCDVKNWQLQATNVCFGTRDDSFGEFYFRESGKLLKLKLNHVGEASLNCCPSCTSAGSRWGCQAFPEKIYTVITDGGDNIILPNPAPSHSFFLPGFNGVSPFIEFNASNMHVERNQVYKIWYLDDFYPKLEGDNTGRSCADVYAVFWD